MNKQTDEQADRWTERQKANTSELKCKMLKYSTIVLLQFFQWNVNLTWGLYKYKNAKKYAVRKEVKKRNVSSTQQKLPSICHLIRRSAWDEVQAYSTARGKPTQAGRLSCLTQMLVCASYKSTHHFRLINKSTASPTKHKCSKVGHEGAHQLYCLSADDR